MVTTAHEFKAARESLGLSVNDLAYVLNTNARTIIKWENNGDMRSPNPVACRVMDWMLEGYEPPEMKFLTATASESDGQLPSF